MHQVKMLQNPQPSPSPPSNSPAITDHVIKQWLQEISAAEDSAGEKFHARLLAISRRLGDGTSPTRERTRRLLLECGRQLASRVRNSADEAQVAVVVEAWVQVLLDRLLSANHQQPDLDFVEPAEELRLLTCESLVEVLSVQVPPKKDTMRMEPGWLDRQFVRLLRVCARVLADPYADVRKAGCQLVVQLSKCAPERVAMAAKNSSQNTVLSGGGDLYKDLVDVLLANLLYKHASVRAAVLQALDRLVRCDSKPLEDSQTIEQLQRVLFDKSAAVRQALYATIGNWLLYLRDRYGFAGKLLPLFMCGLVDSVSSAARQLCTERMVELGRAYEEDFVDRVKDELDYVQTDGDIQAVSFNVDALAKGVRPRVGCRHLIRDNVQQSVRTLLGMAEHWQPEARLLGCKALCVLIPYAERNITGYSNLIVRALVKHNLVLDECREVRQAALECAQLLGRFVRPDVYLEVVKPLLLGGSAGVGAVESQPSASSRTAALLVLGGLIRGLEIQADEDRNSIVHLFMELFADRSLAGSDHTALLEALIDVLKVWIQRVSDLELTAAMSDEDQYQLYYGVLALCSRTDTEEIMNRARNELMPLFSRVFGVEAWSAQFERFIGSRFLPECIASQKQWSRFSIEPRMICTLVRMYPKDALACVQMWPLFGTMAQRTILDQPKDWDCDLRLLILELLLQHTDDLVGALVGSEELAMSFVADVVVPNLFWRVGRREAVVRERGLALLQSAFNHSQPAETLLTILRKVQEMAMRDAQPDKPGKGIFELVMYHLDDDAAACRESVLRILKSIFTKQILVLDEEQCKSAYQELIKRFDDSSDELRILSAQVLANFFRPGCCIENLDKVHFEHFLKAAIVHLDDANPKVQHAFCEMLIVSARNQGGVIPSDVMRAAVEPVRLQHRSTTFIDLILAAL